MKVIDVDIAVDIARRAIRDSEYGYSYDDLSMEVERDMQSNSLEYNELDTLQEGIDPSDSRENIEQYWILKE